MFCSREVDSNFLAMFDKTTEPQFYCFIQREAGKLYSFFKSHFFSYTMQDSTYFYAYKEHSVVQAHVIFINKGPFSSIEFIDGFKKFQAAVKLFSPPRRLLITAKDLLMQPVIQYIKNHQPSLEKSFEEQVIEFVVPGEKIEFLKNLLIPKLPSPDYSLGPLDPNFAEFVMSKWRHGEGQGEVEHTRLKASNIPTSAIYFKKSPIGWILSDTGGNLQHHFVMEEYRQQGLGKILEIDIAKKMIERGEPIYKHVDEGTFVEKATLRSGFWEARRKKNGSYDYITWIQLDPKK